MAAEVSFVTNRKNHGFLSLLSSAACEWFLILLLFVEAVFSYLLPKFAQYCELETPCPFCSRLDHIFGNKEPGFCWTLICKNHKQEISSLMSCAIHGNLAGIEEMCEECLMSTTVQEDSKSGAYKLLVGKFWVDVEKSALQNLMLNKHIKLDSSSVRTCSCCNKTQRAISSTERLFELEQAGLGASKSNLKPPLPRMPGRSRSSRREHLKKMRNKVAGTSAQKATGRNAVDKLSHVGYTKIKFTTSGSESEVLLSEDDDDDDDDDGNVSAGSNFSRSEYEVKIGRRGIPRPPLKNVSATKQTNQSLKDKSDVLDSQEPKTVNPTSSDAVRDNDSREVESQSFQKPSPSLTTIPTELEDVAKTPNVGIPGTSEESFSFPRNAALSTISELHSLCKVPSSSVTVTSTKSIKVGGPSEQINTSVTIHVEAPGGSSSSDVTRASNPNSQNLTESCENAVRPMNASASSKTEEEKNAFKQESTSKLGSFSKDASSKPQDKQGSSVKDDDSSSPVLTQASTSDVGSISPRETSSKPQDKPNESGIGEETHEEQNESKRGGDIPDEHSETKRGKGVPDKQNESKKGGAIPDKQNESGKGEETCSQAQSQISRARDLSPKENGPKPDGEHGISKKGEDSISQAPSQASMTEMGGVLPKDTSPRTDKELKEFMSNEVGVIFPKDTGLRPLGKFNESGKDEDSSNLLVPESPSVKRNESAYEVVSESEDESVLDRLRQHIENDRNMINSLYEELEEERNAATIAANEAMVMITKLQEEKAALHTEALQYLRMMEEQAEYDMEELRRVNDLLAEREKENQDLEDELEFYRNNFEESGVDHNENSVLENHAVDNSENNPHRSDSKLANVSKVPLSTSPSEFENEKLYVVEFMNKLEEELRRAYCSEKLDSMSNRLNPEVGNLNDSSLEVETLSHSQTEESNSTVQKNSSTSSVNSAQHPASNDIHDEKGDRALDAFEKEHVVPDNRLEALETDRNFLRHASGLLWSGKDGLQLIQEVADQLKELRMIEFKKR